MTDATNESEGSAPDDDLRQHAESGAEGSDDSSQGEPSGLDESGADIPREHAEDPAEG
jgi:hypothetical protein